VSRAHVIEAALEKFRALLGDPTPEELERWSRSWVEVQRMAEEIQSRRNASGPRSTRGKQEPR
jgi:hypothetical protein